MPYGASRVSDGGDGDPGSVSLAIPGSKDIVARIEVVGCDRLPFRHGKREIPDVRCLPDAGDKKIRENPFTLARGNGSSSSARVLFAKFHDVKGHRKFSVAVDCHGGP